MVRSMQPPSFGEVRWLQSPSIEKVRGVRWMQPLFHEKAAYSQIDAAPFICGASGQVGAARII